MSDDIKNQHVKVWITKRALTEGVAEMEAEIFRDFPKMIQTVHAGWYHEYYHKPDWHTDISEALERAEKMRQAKIKLLEKQLSLLQAMKFLP